MAFITRFKYSSKSDLLNDNTFIDTNGNVSGDALYEDALVEAYKTSYLKWTEELEVVEKLKEMIEAPLQDNKSSHAHHF